MAKIGLKTKVLYSNFVIFWANMPNLGIEHPRARYAP